MIDDEFEWDDEKAESNLGKHGVTFEKAVQVFGDPLAVTLTDHDHSFDELREITIGTTFSSQAVVVCHTQRGERTRIISARYARPAEIRRFMERKRTDMINDAPPDPLDREFDFSNGVVGKHYRPHLRKTIFVRIHEDVVPYFPTAEDVNEALRMLIAEGRAPALRDK